MLPKLSKTIISALIMMTFVSSFMSQAAFAADSLQPSDFRSESWSKSLDLFEYVRKSGNVSGAKIPEGWSTDLRLNYINVSGVKLLYAGFAGVSADNVSLIVPLQAFIEHFKTRDGLDAVTASSFLMMMAFNDSSTSLHPDSPDQNDNLWASFSLGRNLEQFFGDGTPPQLSSSVETIPLASNGDKTVWTWEMRYKNLMAIWWSLNRNGGKPGFNPFPMALTVYDELSFSYRLVLDPAQGTAKLYLSYTIGEVRDLWLLGWFGFLPILVHYNDTGAYTVNKRVSDENVHRFLVKNNIKMSLILFQRSLVIDHATRSVSSNQNVTDSSVDVSSGSVQTISDTNQKVYEVGFGEKETYQLYNSTSGGVTEHDAVTRTSEIKYYLNNPVILVQTSLLRFLPKVIRLMVANQHQNEVEEQLNVTKVDYLYITSYPVFGGYKIVHDPLYTAYFKPTEQVTMSAEPLRGSLPLLLIAVGAVTAVVIIIVLKRR